MRKSIYIGQIPWHMTIPKERPLSVKETDFIESVRTVCKDNGIKFDLRPKKNVVVDGTRCVGYFSPDPLELVCATNRADFIPVLVHESCHLDQFLEDRTPFDEEDVIDSWLHGKEFTQKQINASIKNSISLELDCEKRSVKKIVEYGLDININQYIQGANAYILFYNFVKKNRVWYRKDTPPHEKFLVYETMPKKFMSDSYYYKLNPKIEKLFKKHIA